jgi:hypothetical protein
MIDPTAHERGRLQSHMLLPQPAGKPGYFIGIARMGDRESDIFITHPR